MRWRRSAHRLTRIFCIIPCRWSTGKRWKSVRMISARRRWHAGLGSFPFARRYLGNHCCFLFLRLLRCFSSPGSLYMAMYSPYSDRSFSCRVSPFRNLRVNGYLLLTVAYRSLSRLSSALSAKASTLRSCSLDLLFQCISDNTPARFLRDECMITK